MRTLILAVLACLSPVIFLAMVEIAQAKEEYPGAACDSVLYDVETFAMNARVWRDSMIHNYLQASKKRKKGDKIGAQEELKYAQKNEDDLAKSYAGFAGSVALASQLGCDKDAISRASKCGFVNMREKCQ